MAILSAVLPLVGSAEDLASRALRHVLDSSAHAREAFNELLSFPSGTHWTAQHVLSGEDGAGRPDLAGHSRGQLVGFVEAKFDAGLTDAQPEEYLKALPDGGQLAALVPQVREDYIAAELVRRCQVHGNAVEPRGRQYVVAAPDGSSRWVMRVVTWDEVIAHLLTSTNEPGAREAHDDLVQLEDLVNTIQDRIWTPIAAEQLTSKSTAQLVTQIVDLLGDLRGPLQGKGIQITGPMTSWSWGGVGLPIKRATAPTGYQIRVDWRLWCDKAATPLWLAVDPKQRGGIDPLIRDARWFNQSPPRAYWAEHWTTPGMAMPLYIPTGTDRDVVVESLVAQTVEHIDGVERLATQADDSVN